MKYGDTLRQRSIPEWGHFNIDYDYLKDLIKYQTTPGTGKAVSIPGQGGTTERAFGDTFYGALKSQHDRINLFIRSKSGEIERRLDHISKSLRTLQARQAPEGQDGRLPAKVVERYAKIDADVTKAGDEIRSLSRFQVTQRTGFRKILKKYKRWTRDKELERHFRDVVTSSPDSFYQLDLGYLLDQYIDVLGALRAPFDVGGASNASSGKASSPAYRIAQAARNGNEVDFDLALAVTPLGPRGSKATYWIHPDHIVEVQVLLLQQMRLYSGPNATTNPTPKDSPEATPKRRKSSTSTDKYLNSEETVGLLVLDHAESFAIKQNASTIGSIEETTGFRQVKAAGNARWTSSGDAAVVVGLEEPSENIRTAKLKRKNILALLDTTTPFKTRQDSASGPFHQQDGGSERDAGSDITATRQWLSEHKKVEPIASICSNRTRLVGLHNTDAGGMWATLDKDVFIGDSLHKYLNDEDWLSEARTNSVGFPYAVLEIRREGNHSAALMQNLDHSHLVERVRGFSLEAHAVWTCCKPSAMSAPFWVSLLDKDIRKLPPAAKRQRRKAAIATDSLPRTSPPQTSTSCTSLTDGQSSPFASRNGESSATSAPEFVDPPPLKAFRKKRKPYSEYPPPMKAEQETQRYWNEYDNPESEDEGYYIYIDPDAEVKFPGQEFFEACAGKFKKLFGVQEAHDESEPSTAESSDDESTVAPAAAVSQGYGTFGSQNKSSQQEGYFSGLFRGIRDPHREVAALHSIRRETERERRNLLSELQIRQHRAEVTKHILYSTCIVMALIIDALLCTMTWTSRRKEKGVVDTVVLFGTICNLLLCVVAVVAMKTRRERLGWFHQGTIISLVIGNVVVDILLLRWVLTGL